MGTGSRGFVFPGYRQTLTMTFDLMDFTDFGLSVYITQISVGRFSLPVVCIHATVFSAIPSSRRSGRSITRFTRASDNPYNRIFSAACFVHCSVGVFFSCLYCIRTERSLIKRRSLFRRRIELSINRACKARPPHLMLPIFHIRIFDPVGNNGFCYPSIATG